MENNVQEEVEEVKAATEVSLELFIEKAYEPLVDGLIKELSAKIPGAIDDVVFATLGKALKPKAKELLLIQVEKISEKV